MATSNFEIHGARPDWSDIQNIAALFRPFTLEVLRYRLENPFDPTMVEDETARRADIQRQIDDGGELPVPSGSVVGANGIEYEWTPEHDPSGSIFRSAISFDIELAVGDWPEWLVKLTYQGGTTHVQLAAPTPDIDHLDTEIKGILRASVQQELLVQDASPTRPEPRPLSVFIGHGGDRKWEVVRDYILGAGYIVEAFESSPRAGQMTLAVVELMISRADIAVIVMTGVDKLEDGTLHARLNVIHELGFAHGRIGVNNTIVLLEENVTEPTNIAGLTEVRFNVGEAHTTKEHVLAVLANKEREVATNHQH